MRRHGRRAAFLGLLLASGVVWAGCPPRGPEPIFYGEDVCDFCVMTIADARYGAQLLTTRGRALKFDAVECLAAEYLGTDTAEVASVWVTDFAEPGEFVDAETAAYLRSPMLRSPMGLNLTAFRDAASLEPVRARYGGEVLDWPAVLRLVQAAWLQDGATRGGMPHTHGPPEPDARR